MINVDRPILAKAIGIMCLGWLALPIVYYLLKRGKKGKEKEDERNIDILE